MPKSSDDIPNENQKIDKEIYKNISNFIARRLGLLNEDVHTELKVDLLVDTLMMNYPNQFTGPEALYEKLEPYLGDNFLVGNLSMADFILAHFYFDHWVQTEDDDRQQEFLDASPKLE